MADKLINITGQRVPSQAHLSSSGSTATEAISIFFDEDTPLSTMTDLLEVAKCDLIDFYAKNHK